MILRCCGSGSSGNSYSLITKSGEILAVEAGCHFHEFMKMVSWQTSRVCGCIITHKHKDHAKYVKDFLKSGICVYGPKETVKSIIEASGTHITPIQALKRFCIGEFTITPFNVPHEPDIECYGYLIEHKEIGKLLFLTDLEYCPYNFRKSKLNHIIVEANHDPDYMDRGAANFQHVIQGHMSIDTTCEFLRCNNSSELRNVILCHLSSSNADQEAFVKKAKEIVNCPVFIAGNGLEVDLSGECPF